jgi:hypothetical protein
VRLNLHFRTASSANQFNTIFRWAPDCSLTTTK